MANSAAGHVKKARRSTKTSAGTVKKARRTGKATLKGHVTHATRTRVK